MGNRAHCHGSIHISPQVNFSLAIGQRLLPATIVANQVALCSENYSYCILTSDTFSKYPFKISITGEVTHSGAGVVERA